MKFRFMKVSMRGWKFFHMNHDSVPWIYVCIVITISAEIQSFDGSYLNLLQHLLHINDIRPFSSLRQMEMTICHSN